MATASTPSFPFVRNAYQDTRILAPASTVIQPGDAVAYVNGGTCQTAAAFTWTSNLTTTQTNFKSSFLGFSNDYRQSFDASTGRHIRILTQGIVRMPCTALVSALEVGTFVGLAQDASNSLNLSNQLVASVASVGLAIGRLIDYAPAGSTQLTFFFQSTLTQGILA